MKKNYLFSAALIAAMLSSCSQDEGLNLMGEDNKSFTGVVEAIGSRTSLNESNNVVWNLDDEISIFQGTNKNRLYYVSAIDNGKATFSYRSNTLTGELINVGANYAVYPWSDYNNIDTNGKITAPISDTYKYVEKKDAIATALMVAKSDTKSFNFTNAQGIFRMSLSATFPEDWGKIKSFTFASNSVKLSGTATMEWDGTNPPAAKADGGQLLTVKFENPVDIPEKGTGELDIYLPVVPAQFPGGDLTFTFECEKGTHSVKTPNNWDFEIKRAAIQGISYYIPAEDNFDGTIEDNLQPIVSVYTMSELQNAIDNAEGNAIIKFEQDINANSSRATNNNIIIVQKEGVDLVIDGDGHKFDGTFYLQGQARYNEPETLIFKNINFEHTDASNIDFISCDETASKERYAHNVTVESCTFIGNDNANVVGMRYRQCYNMFVKNSTFTNMHSAMWATGGNGLTFENVTVNNSKNGISLGTTTGVFIDGGSIDALYYGIRADGNTTTETTIQNLSINANQPIIIRKVTGNYSVKLVENVTLNTSDKYEVVFTNGSDDATYVEPSGNYSIEGEGDYDVFPKTSTETPAIASTADDLTKYLKDTNYKEIRLAAGITFEGTFNVKREVSIKSQDASNKATIKGRVNVSSNGTFNNIKFDINDDSKAKNTFTGANYKYPAIIVIYAVATTFEGCEFKTDIATGVCGINYAAHGENEMLSVNNCSFTGDFYAIRTRTHFSITNSYFDIYTSQGKLAAVWTWGNGNNWANSVTFTGNINKNENEVYSVQLTSKTWAYNNINFNVQGNKNFASLDSGVNTDCDFTGCTFAEGSETF